MKAGWNCNPNQSQYSSADKTSAGLILVMAQSHWWNVADMGIKNAYVNETSQYRKPIYVKELPTSAEQYPHGQRVVLHRKHLCGGKSAGFYYIKRLLQLLTKHGYTQSDSDPCWVSRLDKQGRIWIYLNLDDLLITATHTELVDNFYENWAEECRQKDGQADGVLRLACHLQIWLHHYNQLNWRSPRHA